MIKSILLALLVTLALAVPTQAQNAFAWPESKRQIAETASNITVYTQLGLDTAHSWRSQDKSKAFSCQAIRLGIALSTTEILKRVIHKERPDGSDFKSFPSMHTAVAMASAGWDFRIGVPIAIGTGIFRMGANKHDIYDVLGGAGIGYFSHWIGPCDQ